MWESLLGRFSDVDWAGACACLDRRSLGRIVLGDRRKEFGSGCSFGTSEGFNKVDDQGFAIAQDELLRNARQYEGTATRRPVRVFVSGSGKTARFIEEILRPASVSAPCKIRFSSRPSTSMHVAACMSSDELDIRI